MVTSSAVQQARQDIANRLRELRLDGTSITDAGLDYLKGMSELETLWVYQYRVTEKGLKEFIKAVPDCTIVWSSDGLVNAMIDQQQDLTGAIREYGGSCARGPGGEIIEIRVGTGGLPLSDVGLAYLKDVTTLKSLIVTGNPLRMVRITDSGLAQLHRLRALETLGLNCVQITDAGLVYLKQFPKLRSLELRGLPITDVGLEHLKEIETLRLIVVDSPRITPAGVAALQRSLPECQVQAP